MDEMTGNPAPEADVLATPATETEHDDVDTILDIEDETNGERDEIQKDEQPKPLKLKVKIDGQELEVDAEEAAKGYQRQADYSRHMQRLQAEAQQVQQMRDIYQQRIDQFIPEQEARLQYMQQELSTLATEDPAAWVVKQQEFQTELQRYQMGIAERQRLEQETAQAKQQQAQALYQRAEQAVMQAIPEWKDPETRSKEAAEITKVIRAQVEQFYGHETDRIMAEINAGHYGPMPILLAHKAMKYDALMAKVAARKGSKSDMTEAPEPLQIVKTKGSAGKDPSKMSTEEWMAWRNKQVRG